MFSYSTVADLFAVIINIISIGNRHIVNQAVGMEAGRVHWWIPITKSAVILDYFQQSQHLQFKESDPLLEEVHVMHGLDVMPAHCTLSCTKWEKDVAGSEGRGRREINSHTEEKEEIGHGNKKYIFILHITG